MSNETLNVAVSTADLLLKDWQSQVQALEARKNALLQTVEELEQQIGDNLMPQAIWRKEYDALRERCRKFADS